MEGSTGSPARHEGLLSGVECTH